MGDLRLWRILSSVFVLAVAVNYPWEMLQASLYRMDTGSLPTWLHCFRASLGDGVLILLILILGAGILGRLDWFRRPGLPGYAWMLTSGLMYGSRRGMDGGARPEPLVLQAGDAAPARSGHRARPCSSDAGPSPSDFRCGGSAWAQATSPKGRPGSSSSCAWTFQKYKEAL